MDFNILMKKRVSFEWVPAQRAWKTDSFMESGKTEYTIFQKKLKIFV